MIIDKLAEKNIRLKSYSLGNHKTICPQCSHTRKKKQDPCLSVSIEADEAKWNCHNSGCDFAGMVSNHSKQYYNDNFTTRTRQSKKEERIIEESIQYSSNNLTSNAQQWFQGRGITQEVLRRNKIGCGEHYVSGEGKKVNCIQFPYFRNGNVVNIKYRTGSKKFAQVKGAEKIYYGLDDIKKADSVIITEGEMDKLALEVVGYENVISVPDGAPSTAKNGEVNQQDDKKFEYVWNCEKELEDKKILLAVDMDEPGRILADELARRYGRDRCLLVKWPEKDANETLVKSGKGVVIECIQNAIPYPVAGLKSVNDIIGNAISVFEKGVDPGLSTGWKALDQHLRISPGELSIVTGVPGSGKSEFIDAMMVNMSELYDWCFAICSFENPVEMHLGKLCEKKLRKPFDNKKLDCMTVAEFEQVARIWASKHFCFISHDGLEESATIDWILERARSAVRQYGINGLVIDPYNEIEHSIPPGMTETNYISQLLTKVRKFARNHAVHVWFVAHPSKPQKSSDGKYNAPSLYDISGSANWLNKADMGIVVHRPKFGEYHNDITEIHIRKVRQKKNGQPGVVEFRYNTDTGCYAPNQSIG